MAKYLLTVTINGDSQQPADVAAPPEYFLEWIKGPFPQDGLEQWNFDLQLAGTVADWVNSTAYSELWTFIETALAKLEMRPRGVLTIKSRTDARRVAATIPYMGDHQIHSLRDDLKTRVAGHIEPGTRRLKGDLTFATHP